MPGVDPEHPDFVAALARGLAVIEAFDGEHRRLSLTQVAARTELSRGTARRFLLTLVTLGYAATDGKAFWLMPRVLRLGYAYLSALDIGEIAQPVVQALSQRLNELCSVAVLDGQDITFVARAEAKRNYRMALTIGGRLPAHASSIGRVLLSGLPDADLDTFLDRVELRAFTPKTTMDKQALRSAILKARKDGYATVDDELQIGIRSGLGSDLRSGRPDQRGDQHRGAHARNQLRGHAARLRASVAAGCGRHLPALGRRPKALDDNDDQANMSA